jgi:DNA-binding MarR family transcriptional regulator
MPTTNLESEARRAFTRLARLVNKFMRDQLACGPITMQQCYALEALVAGPRTMGELADDVALHQTTITRIVARLERLGYISRVRPEHDQRRVDVCLTPSGEALWRVLDAESHRIVGAMLDALPADRRRPIIDAVATLADAFEADNPTFAAILEGCCPPAATQEVGS